MPRGTILKAGRHSSFFPRKSLVVPSTQWQSLILPLDVEDMKTLAAFAYRSQMQNVELRDLIVSSIRKNEILASPK
jgi:hypothetical protein